jgi:hypothetical protein
MLGENGGGQLIVMIEEHGKLSLDDFSKSYLEPIPHSLNKMFWPRP